MAPPPDGEAEARKEAGVGIGLADDLRHVRTARTALKTIDVTLLDHVIVTPTGSVSFQEHGLL